MIPEVSYVWLYTKEDESWVPFDTWDQEVLEKAHVAHCPLLLSVQGGRKEVNMDERLLYPRYWVHPPRRVIRSLWSCGGVPYEEHHDQLLEEWYEAKAFCAACLESPFRARCACKTLVLEDLGVEIYRGEFDALTEASRGRGERPVRRGGAFTAPVSPACANMPVESLVLTVHGIGESLWSKHRFRQTGLVEYTEMLRDEVHRQTAAATHPREGRMEFLPIEWYQLLHDENAVLTDQLASITLPSIPLLRTFSNDAVADVLFYTSEDFRRKILMGVNERLNWTFDLFFGYNPHVDRDIPVNLVGHSLGSVILYDLLCLQGTPELDPRLRLRFQPQCLFFLGSPLGLFLTVRGLPPNSTVALPEGVKCLNILHLNDPVAYRIEPLILRDAADVYPKQVPHHLDGGVRTHVMVRNTIAQLWKVPLQFFTPEGHGLRGAWEAAAGAVEMVTTWTPSANTERQKEITAALLTTTGYRVDWVLQEVSVGAAMANAYLSAIVSHCSYFQHPDVAGFIMSMTKFIDFKHQSALANHHADGPISP